MLVPDSVGVMILSNAVLFPQAMLPLYIFEPRYRTMLAEALGSHRMFCVAMLKPGSSRETPCPVAGLGVIRAAVKNPDGTSNLILQGVARVKLASVVRYKPYRLQKINMLDVGDSDTVLVDALRARVLELAEARIRNNSVVSADLLRQLVRSGGHPDDPPRAAVGALRLIASPGHLADLLTLLLVRSANHRQMILQAADIADRFRYLVLFLDGDLAEERADDSTPF